MADKTITEYLALANSNPLELSKKINEKIAEGWQPFHGVVLSVALSERQHSASYVQALVKYA